MFYLPPPPPAIVITNNGGGDVSQFAAQFEEYKKQGISIKIDGYCASSCTMFLGNPKTCVTPNSILGFHQAYFRHEESPYDASDRSEEGTRVMWSHYPAKLKNWILSKGGLTKDLIYLSGKELLKVVKICK